MDVNGDRPVSVGDFERARPHRSFRRIIVVLVAGLAGVCAAAWSLGSRPAVGEEAHSGIVDALRAKGVAVTALGRRGALDGWWVEPGGRRPYALYVDETGHAVMGVLYARDGQGVTSRQLEAMRAVRDGVAPAAPATALPGRGGATVRTAAAAGVLEGALAVEGFDLGETGPQVAIFADPGCLPSRMAVARLARRALAGEIMLRVVPVGVLGEASERLASVVLEAEDRAGAWFALEGVRSAPAATEAVRAAVRMNGRMLERSGTEFVPFSLMRGTDGKTTAIVGSEFAAWFGGAG